MLVELFYAFTIVAICVVIHAVSMVYLLDWLHGQRSRIEKHEGVRTTTLLLILVFAVVMLLHLSHTGLWAGFYYWRGLFKDYETAFYFSLGSYTTIGYGDIVLPQQWRLLGGVEGISGVLLCGLSTAFIFGLINALFQIRIQKTKTS